MIKQNETNEKNAFLLRVRARHIVDTKKLFFSLFAALLFLGPTTAFATTSADCQKLYGQTFEWDQNRNNGTGSCVNTTNGQLESIPPAQPTSSGDESTGSNTSQTTQGQPGGSNSNNESAGLNTSKTIQEQVGGANNESVGLDTSKTPDQIVNGIPSGTTNQPTNQTTASPGNTPAFCSGGICSYIPLEPLPGQNINGSGPQTGTSSFAALLAAAFKLLVTLGSLFAVVMIVISGISYMLSETPLKMEAAKDRAWAAMKGLLLLGAAWLIIYTINPKLLNFDLFSNDLAGYTKSQNTAVPANGQASIQAPTSQDINNCQNTGGVPRFAPDNSFTCIR